MILMKENVSLTTVAIKMGKKYFYGDHSRDKILHPGHVTLISWIFLKFLPVVGIIET